MSLEKKIQSLKKSFIQDLKSLKKNNKSNLRNILHNQYLSRRGAISELFSSLSKESQSKKAELGSLINDLKYEITNTINSIADTNLDSEDSSSNIDITIPGDDLYCGSVHPITKVILSLE